MTSTTSSKAAEGGAGHFRLLEASLALARRQLAEQASLLGDAQQRVESLVSAQRQLRSAVGADGNTESAEKMPLTMVPVVAPTSSSELPPLPPAPLSPTVSSLSMSGSTGEGEQKKINRLRELLGASVRTQSEQASELAAVRKELTEEQSALEGLVAQQGRDQAALREAEELVKSLSAQLSSLQLEAQEQEKTSCNRIIELEAK
mmetsp:Transcript_1304/g.3359  ORF Transcript_1304/g.3359 Transcript_1304/m.3359 type:complete len:204 (-) Transcript_1304:521-1132(-)